jgi:hypothetical protein
MLHVFGRMRNEAKVNMSPHPWVTLIWEDWALYCRVPVQPCCGRVLSPCCQVTDSFVGNWEYY